MLHVSNCERKNSVNEQVGGYGQVQPFCLSSLGGCGSKAAGRAQPGQEGCGQGPDPAFAGGWAGGCAVEPNTACQRQHLPVAWRGAERRISK